jgi:type I restriction enzyme S subunit
MRRVRVGDVLELRRRPVEIEAAAEYQLIGVYSFGKGIFHREPTVGASLGNYRYFAIHPGDLVLSNIQAWEGAIAHASEADRGTIGTHRFLSYTAIDPNEIDTNWARYYFLSDAGFPLIQAAAPGSVTRNRTLAVERFEALEVTLPSIEEQRRVAAHLDRVALVAQRSQAAAPQSLDRMRALGESAVQRVLDNGIRDGWDLVPLSSVATINPRRERLAPDTAVAFVPMSALDDRTGMIVSAETRLAGEVGSGYKQFQNGDVIFARITPCMQNGKSAVVGAGLSEFGYGSTEFHVVRPGPAVEAKWLHAVFRTQHFRSAAADRFTGTAGQQRVPAAFLEEVAIPLPPTRDAQQEALSEIGLVIEKNRSLVSAGEVRSALLAALLPAALNSSFSEMA